MKFFSRAKPAQPKKPAVKRLNSAFIRFFAGAVVSRMLSSWLGSSASFDNSIRDDLERLRARARELASNNPYVRRYLNLVQTNVIGPKGMRLQAQLHLDNGELDKALNDALEAAWERWCRHASADGSMTLTQVAQLAARTLATDGEVFVRKITADLNSSWFAIELIDAALVDHTFNRPASVDHSGRVINEIRMGIEIDEWSRPVAYHIWNRPQDDIVGAAGRERIRVPADEVLHLFRPDNAGQTRGVSWLNPVMLPLHHLEKYTEAELTAARSAAAKMGFFQFSDAAVSHLVEEDVSVEGQDYPIPTEPYEFSAEAGSLEMLPPGLEFKPWDPSHPTTAYEAFVKNILRQVASGLGVSYPTLANDPGDANYSSMRSSALVERDEWRVLQRLFADNFYTPIFNAWLENAQMSGELELPDNVSSLTCCEHIRFIARGWSWVDPQKDINASIAAIHNGLASRSQLAAEQGSDFEETLHLLAQEKELADKLGVTLGAPDKAQNDAAHLISTLKDELLNED